MKANKFHAALTVDYKITNLITGFSYTLRTTADIAPMHISKRLIEQILEQVWMWDEAVKLGLALKGGTFMGVRLVDYDRKSVLYRVKENAVYNDEQQWPDSEKEDILMFEFLGVVQ